MVKNINISTKIQTDKQIDIPEKALLTPKREDMQKSDIFLYDYNTSLL